MSQPNHFNKSVIPLEQDNTMIVVIEMGQASCSWQESCLGWNVNR